MTDKEQSQDRLLGLLAQAVDLLLDRCRTTDEDDLRQVVALQSAIKDARAACGLPEAEA